jgi:hypothetical protein
MPKYIAFPVAVDVCRRIQQIVDEDPQVLDVLDQLVEETEADRLAATTASNPAAGADESQPSA